MVRVCNFSSGSDGNCTYVQVDGTHLLIDAGMSASNIVSALQKIGVKPAQIDAILITHDHSDHIKGLNVFAGKYNINIYAHISLWKVLSPKLDRVLSVYKHVFYEQPFTIGGALVDSLELSHDATNTRAFCVGDGKNSFTIATDLGTWDDHLIDFAKNSALVYIESNHDEQMLRENQNYSFFLKSRILSNKGHLSNNQCARVIEQLSMHKTKQFVLSHLSKENNTPDLAFETVCAYLASKDIIEGKHIKIDIASTEMGNQFIMN